MKIITILGTRPEIIRLSRVIEKIDGLCEHILVHTGQNYDPRLSEIFFQELGVRQPDHYLNIRGSFAEQISKLFVEAERLFRQEAPDKCLVLGDTNSALSAVVAKRMGIPVYHMEAGNRCYDDRVPEEVNRRIIDHSSDILMPYTERSRQNLIREGIAGDRVLVIGNPIFEVLQQAQARVNASRVLSDLGLEKGGYFLVTVHRAENVDSPQRLNQLTRAFDLLQRKYNIPVVISTHPHTRLRMDEFGIVNTNDKIVYSPPFPFYDFIALELNARCVLTDSGTVQEECAIKQVANVTIRDTTERPETLECGSNILSGVDPIRILECVAAALANAGGWKPPGEYLIDHVSKTVVKILSGYHPIFLPAN